MPKSSWPNRGHRIKHLIHHGEKEDVIPNPDKRSLQKIIMALSEAEFQRMTQMLSLTPNLTPNEVRNMLLDEEKKKKKKQAAVTKGAEAPSNESSIQGEGGKVVGEGEGEGRHCDNCKKKGHSEDGCWLLHPEIPRKPPCSTCGKSGHGEAQCWIVNTKLAPAWLQKRLLKQNNTEANGKGKKEKAKKEASSNGSAE